MFSSSSFMIFELGSLLFKEDEISLLKPICVSSSLLRLSLTLGLVNHNILTKSSALINSDMFSFSIKGLKSLLVFVTKKQLAVKKSLHTLPLFDCMYLTAVASCSALQFVDLTFLYTSYSLLYLAMFLNFEVS